MLKIPGKEPDGGLKPPEGFEGKNLSEYSPALLAYIGDAVYELYVRTCLVAEGNRRVRDVHRDTVSLVKAASQARLLREIAPQLSEEEKAVMMRGRNTRITHFPRSANPGEYRLSTGLEALIGYLYLKGEEERLKSWVRLALSKHETWNH